MEQKKLIQEVAYLEFVQDQLTSELQEVDALLKSVGFPHGLESAKKVAQEMIDELE